MILFSFLWLSLLLPAYSFQSLSYKSQHYVLLKETNEHDETPKLGIDLTDYLGPLTEQEAQEIQAAANEIVNEAFAKGIDEMETLRTQLREEVERAKQEMARRSDDNAKIESERLLQRIDSITNKFMDDTRASRDRTKRIVEADVGMAGRGMEVGSWGKLSDGSVLSMVGSGVEVSGNPKICIVADIKGDEYARRLVEPLQDELLKVIPDLEFVIQSPTATSMGSEGASCILLFFTSLNDATSVKKTLDRTMRQTMSSDGTILKPATQLVAVASSASDNGLARLFGDGGAEKRQQMAEAIVSCVGKSDVATDYTIGYLGNLKTTNKLFSMEYGNGLGGDVDLDTAVQVLVQAMALQPAARNTTFGIAGALTDKNDLDDCFLKLDGPELWRRDLSSKSDADLFESLSVYVQEWAALQADKGEGLTTPVRALQSRAVTLPPAGISSTSNTQLVFLPTATGSNYMSKEEEREREREGKGSSQANGAPVTRGIVREGGIEFCVETTDDGLRVRAKRCNYGDDAVIKELSEETILSRFKKSVDVWAVENSKRLQ